MICQIVTFHGELYMSETVFFAIKNLLSVSWLILLDGVYSFGGMMKAVRLRNIDCFKVPTASGSRRKG